MGFCRVLLRGMAGIPKEVQRVSRWFCEFCAVPDKVSPAPLLLIVNTFLPISMTELGMVTFELQPKKALSPTPVTESGIVMFANERQPWKAKLPALLGTSHCPDMEPV